MQARNLRPGRLDCRSPQRERVPFIPCAQPCLKSFGAWRLPFHDPWPATITTCGDSRGGRSQVHHDFERAQRWVNTKPFLITNHLERTLWWRKSNSQHHTLAARRIAQLLSTQIHESTITQQPVLGRTRQQNTFSYGWRIRYSTIVGERRGYQS